MIINYGPKKKSSSSGIDFNFGGKFNPMQHLIFSYGNKTNISLEDIDEGICEFISENGQWELKILQNCDIQFTKQAKDIVIFMIGGGNGGSGGSKGIGDWKKDNNGNYILSYIENSGGQGGNGGKRILESNFTFLKDNIYTFNIGEGGPYSSSSDGSSYVPTSNQNSFIKLNTEILLSTSSDTAQFSVGGAGAINKYGGPDKDDPYPYQYNGYNGTYQQAISGESGVSFHETYYGGGGGGGREYHHNLSSYDYPEGAEGGKGGGGHGYGTQVGDKLNGVQNTGGGGGGGAISTYEYNNSDTVYNGGNGGSGIIILSNYE